MHNQDTTTQQPVIDTYNVSLFVQVRVGFQGIKASSPEQAAEIADSIPLHDLVSTSCRGLVTDVDFQDEPAQMIAVAPVVNGSADYEMELVLDADRHADHDALSYLRSVYRNKAKDDNGTLLEPFLHMPAGTLQAEAEAWFAKLASEVSTTVPVKHWDSYGADDTAPTHTMECDDRREKTGQFFLTIRGDEQDADDTLAATAEISSDPVEGVYPRPCLHIHFDDSELGISIFKSGRDLLIRPETDVELTSFSVPVGGTHDKPVYGQFYRVHRSHDEEVDLPEAKPDWTLRRMAAQEAYENYNFGEVGDYEASGWEWVAPGDSMWRTVYGPNGSIRFTVTFAADDTVIEATAS